MKNDSNKFDYEMLLKTCILNGCDYCQSIKGIGFKTALKLVKEFQGDIKSIINHLKHEKGMKIRDDFLQDYQRAELTFKYQVIFDTEL
jgi:5'-3' exonuclease